MNVTLLALGAALAAPLLTYLGVIRRLSGKVKTSDAAQLWEESRSIRQALTERNSFLQDVIDRHTERIDKLEQTVQELAHRNGELERENRTLEKLVQSHEGTIRRLEDENATLTRRVAELEEAHHV